MNYNFPLDLHNVIIDSLGLTNLEFHLRTEWGARAPNHREQIHQRLMELRYTVSSISHTEDMGGFAASQDSNVQLGFDIEVSERVSDKIARRICTTDEEYSMAPTPALLWVAKEAGFKSLKGSHQPQTVLSIFVGHWREIQKNIFFCQMSSPRVLNLGLAFSYEKYAVSLFKVKIPI